MRKAEAIRKSIDSGKRKGRKVDTWEDCLIPNVRTSLENGKIYLLK